jgi:hypothetical protein
MDKMTYNHHWILVEKLPYLDRDKAMTLRRLSGFYVQVFLVSTNSSRFSSPATAGPIAPSQKTAGGSEVLNALKSEFSNHSNTKRLRRRRLAEGETWTNVEEKTGEDVDGAYALACEITEDGDCYHQDDWRIALGVIDNWRNALGSSMAQTSSVLPKLVLLKALLREDKKAITPRERQDAVPLISVPALVPVPVPVFAPESATFALAPASAPAAAAERKGGRLTQEEEDADAVPLRPVSVPVLPSVAFEPGADSASKAGRRRNKKTRSKVVEKVAPPVSTPVAAYALASEKSVLKELPTLRKENREPKTDGHSKLVYNILNQGQFGAFK